MRNDPARPGWEREHQTLMVFVLIFLSNIFNNLSVTEVL
jgi:hypothetical protein